MIQNEKFEWCKNRRVFLLKFPRTMKADHFDCSACFLRVPSCVEDPSPEIFSYAFYLSKQFASPFSWVSGKRLVYIFFFFSV